MKIKIQFASSIIFILISISIPLYATNWAALQTQMNQEESQLTPQEKSEFVAYQKALYAQAKRQAEAQQWMNTKGFNLPYSEALKEDPYMKHPGSAKPATTAIDASSKTMPTTVADTKSADTINTPNTIEPSEIKDDEMSTAKHDAANVGVPVMTKSEELLDDLESQTNAEMKAETGDTDININPFKGVSDSTDTADSAAEQAVDMLTGDGDGLETGPGDVGELAGADTIEAASDTVAAAAVVGD